MNVLIFGNGYFSLSHKEHILAKGLAEKGHNIILIWDSKNVAYDWGKPAEHDNITIYDIPLSTYKKDDIIDYDIDVCIGLDQTVSPLVAEFKKSKKCKAFCYFNDYPVHVIDGKEPSYYNFQYSQKFYYWLNCSLELDGIIFSNTVSQEEFYKRYHKKSYIVYPTISIEDFWEEDFSIPTKDYIIGSYSILSSKGLMYLLKAIRTTDFSYHHIFSYYERLELQKIKLIANELPNSIVFYEKSSERDKMWQIYNADMLVFPQIVKWLGTVSIIEASSVKTPIISYDYPIIREYFEDSVFYVQPKNIIDLRKSIEILHNDLALRQELSEKAYKIYTEKFKHKNFVDNIEKVLCV